MKSNFCARSGAARRGFRAAEGAGRSAEVREVEGDLFDIARRLREIDGGYFVLRKGGKFEVHNRKDAPTYYLTVPWSELDARTVELVRRTRAERAAEIFAEMERHNERLKRQAVRESADRAAETAERVLAGEAALRAEGPPGEEI